MDSLQAIQLRRLILASLPNKNGSSKVNPAALAAERINKCFVCQNPSVSTMALVLGSVDHQRFTQQANHALPDCLTSLPLTPPFVDSHKDKETLVLLLGSTGSLGSYILAYLVELPAVARVICIYGPIKAGFLHPKWTLL